MNFKHYFIYTFALLGGGNMLFSSTEAKNQKKDMNEVLSVVSIYSEGQRAKLLDNFLRYTTFCTTSDKKSSTCPSTEGQMTFAQFLLEEIRGLGFTDATLDSCGYLTATLPANTSKPLPTIGFLAHMDTSPDASGEEVKPRIVLNYDGKDILLNKEKKIVLSPKKFPELQKYKGEDLVVTNGLTLLGADDKAGIAAIIGAMEHLISHPEIEHGIVKIAFFPDEEIGRGADHFNAKEWGCQWAYTIDGGEIGELQYENFNAAALKYEIQGCNVHPGSAKGKMLNAALVANELISQFPSTETPQNTEGYEGFYHLIEMEGTVEKATVSFIIRDFDREKFEARKNFARELAKKMNEKYPNAITTHLSDTYYNMYDKIMPQKHIIELASKAMLSLGIVPKVKPIRGGTDGARLSYDGVPCPNLFTGGENFHSRYEYLPVSSLIKASEVIVKIVDSITL